MPSVTQQLADRGVIRPPGFLPTNIMYETMMGSVAYGVSHDTSEKDTYGFDVKCAYHVVRLLGQCEQILTEHDLDFCRNREHLKAIRRGDVTQEDIEKWAAEKERQLEQAFHDSKLPERADEDRIRELLLNCLEDHYGSLDACVARVDPAVSALRDIRDIVERVRGSLDL